LLDGVAGEVLPHGDDPRVAPHFLGHGLLERFLKRDLAHGCYLANMSAIRSLGSGKGLASAKATASSSSAPTRSRMARSSSGESRARPTMCCSRPAMGSPAFHDAISSAGRVSGGRAARMA